MRDYFPRETEFLVALGFRVIVGIEIDRSCHKTVQRYLHVFLTHHRTEER